jgi:hypothetical protein
VTGLILILVIMFAPTGFAGFLRFIKEKWFRRPSDKTAMEETS